MPKINPQPMDELRPEDYNYNPGLYIANTPTFVASLSRKLNLGNFESLDISASLCLPMPAAVGDVDLDILRQIVKDTASEAFSMVSQEITKRVEDIKQLRNADRGRQTEAQ